MFLFIKLSTSEEFEDILDIEFVSIPLTTFELTLSTVLLPIPPNEFELNPLTIFELTLSTVLPLTFPYEFVPTPNADTFDPIPLTTFELTLSTVLPLTFPYEFVPTPNVDIFEPIPVVELGIPLLETLFCGLTVFDETLLTEPLNELEPIPFIAPTTLVLTEFEPTLFTTVFSAYFSSTTASKSTVSTPETFLDKTVFNTSPLELCVLIVSTVSLVLTFLASTFFSKF